MATRTLDYGANTPFSAVFGRPRNLAWPVHAYRVTMPMTASSGRGALNPFERVTLGLIDAVGGGEEVDLAREACLPVDLVRSVVLRLRDRGIIDNDNRIIDRQRHKWERDEREAVYTSALVFRELVGGEVLPFIHILDATNPIRTKDSEQRARTLQPRDGIRDLGAPSAKDVIHAVTQMRKRVDEHSRDARIPTIDQVRVEREPEEYLLDCLIAIQVRDADFRIADPFGVGFSRVLEQVYTDRLADDVKLQNWMTKWFQSLATPLRDDEAQPKVSGPYDTPDNRRRFPNLIRALTPAAGKSQRSVTDVYAALEWALFYACEAYDPAIAVRRLGAESAPDYSQRLSQTAAAIGLDVPPRGFHPIPKGRLDDYKNGKAEMETVVAIALLQAEVDQDHPMHALAAIHPNFIARVRTLAGDRGVRAHGARVTLTGDTELESDSFMRDVVSALLPSVRFDDASPTAPTDFQKDLLLDARTSLLDTFGYPLFDKLGPNAQSALIEAEMFRLVANDGDNAREFTINVSAALESVLRRFLGGAAPLPFPEREYKIAAGDRARRAGLGDLPEGLAQVSPRRVRQALEGTGSTAGASVFALLLTSSEDRLASLARSQPSFLADVGAILDRRGHGNEPRPMPKSDVNALRRTAITTLVSLLELTEED